VPGTKRLAGGDRYSTAAAVARDSFPTGPVPVVYVATGEVAADALAAGPAADVQGGPVLLVGRDAVPASTRTELTRLRPQRIVVLGGTAAISDAVTTELQSLTTGTVTRQAGADRYATAALVATTAFPSPVARVFVATGAATADALAAGAAGARTDSPVLLVTRERVPAPTAAALTTLRPRDITVVGGPAAVSEAVLAQLRAYAAGGTVTRAAGADRYATAASLAQLVWPTTTAVVYLATGREPWDALTGVPAAGRDSAPVLLVERGCMPAATKRALDRLQPTTVVVLGGESAVSSRAASGAAC
jgi:putative cell wall-binding protein